MTRTRLRLAAGLAALASVGILFAAEEEWKVPEAARQRKNPLAPTEANLTAGRKIYADACANCHGPIGKGNGKAAPYLQVKPHDLTAEEIAAETDGELFWKVSEGRIPMPDFGSKLSDDQRWQVILHLRQLQMTAGISAAPSPTPSPTR